MNLNRLRILIPAVACMLAVLPVTLPAQDHTAGYRNPDEINRYLTGLASTGPVRVKVHELCKTFAGIPYLLVEISRNPKPEGNPAVFVAANPEGTSPLASEAALFLIKELTEKPELAGNLTWFILPCGNPDGYGRFFRNPREVDGRNFRPWNDDLDELTDEDGPEDLNGDGLITRMRVKDPDGTMIPDEKNPGMMRRADPAKGEKGLYKILTEGIDNDGDGQYNEDPAGGTAIGITFPCLYGTGQPGTGAWSGSEAETFSLMKFFTEHPEIAMTMVYGSTGWCLVPPKGGRKGTVSLSAIRIPQRYVQMLGADPEKTYSLEEVKELMKAVVPPGTPVDDAMVAGMLDMGPVVNPLEADGKLYRDLADQYKKYLKEKGWSAKRTDPPGEKDGSFELWSFYQLGLPTFSQDFWALPKPKDSLKNAFTAWNDSILKGKGMVPWTEITHPEFGKAEVGGTVPFADLLPLPEQNDTLIRVQVPWVFELAGKIPELAIEEVKAESLGSGVYRLEAWIRNTRQFPFPLAIGQRTKYPPPAIVTLTGKEVQFLAGRERTPLEGIGGYEQKKLTWIIRTTGETDITIRVAPVNAFGSERNIKVEGRLP